ncbi:hypothetical protein KZZ52_01655 [Dactylosporangium sp. AC04546]|uniref:hypothetical protein n=1 Tax=Dactylosporangium sp. AC04546 TaxID=2862460 RepID=UPI001EDFE026|nr:hypothetical protein [Dactylosporangium sp. AC04546]WVK84170.1 hypothetical protein KZZ52_01655 [Dactylosporangium sp. AC04546]
MRKIVLAVAVAAILSITTGCSADPDAEAGQSAQPSAPTTSGAGVSAGASSSAAPSSTGASGSPAADVALGSDPIAWAVCPAVKLGGDALRDPVNMENLGKNAATSRNARLAAAGQQLADRAATLGKAKGTADEKAAADALAATVRDIDAMCKEAHVPY